jgi:hypothetical protein
MLVAVQESIPKQLPCRIIRRIANEHLLAEKEGGHIGGFFPRERGHFMIQFDVGGLFAQFKGMKPQPRMGRLETVQKPEGFLAVGTSLRPEDIGIEAELPLRIYGMPERRLHLVLGRRRKRVHGTQQKGDNQ